MTREEELKEAFELGKKWWRLAASQSYKDNQKATDIQNQFEVLLIAKGEGK